ncbi:MAG: PASTA domain-containing protein, partial [Ruminococcus sp.]
IGGVIFVASLVMNMFQGDSGQKFDYKMPNLIGVDYNEAVNKYGGTINIVVDSQEYNEVERNCIFEQDIEPETPFNKGDTVKVKVSKGLQTVKVPDGTDINYLVFQRTLDELGLKSDIRQDTSDSIQVDNIIRTEPEAGTDVEPGTEILLFVSAGVNKEQIKLDNFVGKTIEEVSIVCSYKGLSNVKRVDAPSYEPEGIVFEQSIPSGTVIESDQELILSVSNGMLPDGEVTFNVSLPDNSEGRFVIDFFSDNENKTIMSSGVILAPEMSNTSVQVKGTGKDIPITVYITNQSNNLRSRIGQYNFDFSTASYTANWEDFYSAINDIDGFHKETEPPTEPPTESPTEAPPEPEPEPTEPPTTAPPATEPPIDYNDYNGDGRPDDMRDLDNDGIPDSWGWIDENGNGTHDWME